ncbi:MAG: tRNA (guanosine(46)-N7)-methyltransferase TrmB [Clostridia bacterium]|nr:tRNA (guanosine(46)-N7)-methyltransferase TrmB [Clostridia bacterium]
MRLRRKKHLDERLELSKEYLLYFEEREHYGRPDPKDYPKLDFKTVFGNDNPVHMEIGCGKGGFITELASKTPDINYIAVEKDDNVTVSAVENAKKAGLKNVKFIICCAENLFLLINDGTIGRIYLNFSCPYPKHTYRNRRLTNPKFLQMYRSFLAKGGGVFQKTDNKPFFDYSLESYALSGYRTEKVTKDLYNSDYLEGNVATEYEKKFVLYGETICRVEAYPD